MNLLIAPVQGHTDAAWRHFYASTYKVTATTFTPFIRLEHGDFRPRDIKDFTSELNENVEVIPQIIFRDKDELFSLVELLKQKKVEKIDLNMGCPFPLQTGHGRGAATIANQSLGEAVEKIVNENPEIKFSLKMRLGMSQSDEWRILLPFLNRISLTHITLHPRVAKQQYNGEINHNQFREFIELSNNPVVYNGDITTPEHVVSIIEKYPDIAGIMLGRGLLGRPSLINEVHEGKEWKREKRLTEMLSFHRSLYNHYSASLCGDSQIISKLKPFWEYSEEEIGRKAWKAIKKAGNLAKYNSAIALIDPYAIN